MTKCDAESRGITSRIVHHFDGLILDHNLTQRSLEVCASRWCEVLARVISKTASSPVSTMAKALCFVLCWLTSCVFLSERYRVLVGQTCIADQHTVDRCFGFVGKIFVLKRVCSGGCLWQVAQ